MDTISVSGKDDMFLIPISFKDYAISIGSYFFVCCMDIFFCVLLAPHVGIEPTTFRYLQPHHIWSLTAERSTAELTGHFLARGGFDPPTSRL